MIELFYMGGPLVMSVLTIILTIALSFGVWNAVQLANSKNVTKFQIELVKSIGLFAMVVGILGQMLGLIGAFEAIEEVGSVSQKLLVGGLKISSITTIYGILIYLLTYLLWFAEAAWFEKANS